MAQLYLTFFGFAGIASALARVGSTGQGVIVTALLGGPMPYDNSAALRKSVLDQLARLNRAEFSQRYRNSLAAPEWQRLRMHVLARDHELCRCCLERRATDVHHLTYRYGMIAPAWALVSVCRECHDKLHAGWWGWPMKPAANDNRTPPTRQYAMILFPNQKQEAQAS